MNLGELHGEIKASLARGSTLDSEIPLMVRRAARWIERNFSLKYMERQGKLTIASEAECAGIIKLPNAFIKSFWMVRMVEKDTDCGPATRYHYLKKVNPKDTWRPEIYPFPSFYWQNGYENLQLSMNPCAGFRYEFGWYQFTDWPSDLEATPWLLANAEDLLITQTLLEFAPRLRDPRLRSLYKDSRDEALKTVSMSDDEANDLDQVNVMQYGLER